MPYKKKTKKRKARSKRNQGGELQRLAAIPGVPVGLAMRALKQAAGDLEDSARKMGSAVARIVPNRKRRTTKKRAKRKK